MPTPARPPLWVTVSVSARTEAVERPAANSAAKGRARRCAMRASGLVEYWLTIPMLSPRRGALLHAIRAPVTLCLRCYRLLSTFTTTFNAVPEGAREERQKYMQAAFNQCRIGCTLIWSSPHDAVT